MPALYGADRAGVEALFTEGVPFTTQPTAEQVDRWLEEESARVFARAGSLDALPDVALPALGGLTVQLVGQQLARQAVHLLVGALVEASRQPELARPNDTTSYAQWLSNRADAALVDLVALVDRYAAAVEVPVEGAVAAAAEWSFPPVTFPDELRF